MALFAFLCGWMLPFYEAHPLGLADDSACLIATGSGESIPTEVGAAVPGEGQPTHCYVCHLMRAMSGAAPPDVARLIVPFEPWSGPSLADSSALAADQAAPASRGPPASL